VRALTPRGDARIEPEGYLTEWFIMDRLSATFSALADPTRRAILARLTDTDARVTDIAAEFPISLNSISKHIRMLERAGLVRRSIAGREHLLSLDAAPLSEAAMWIEHYRRFWEGRLAALEAFVIKQQKRKRK
jgi:DNA-binding transcriptional ArsR family regulator